MDTQLKIPKNIYLAMKFPEDEKQNMLLTELAVSLYQRGILSMGKARELAKMSKWEFHDLLGKRKISRHYSIENFQEDLIYGTSN